MMDPQLSPIEREEKLKKDHSRFVSSSLIQEKLYTRLALGDHKMSESSQWPSRIFKVCIEALTEFGPMVSTTHHSFKATSLKQWLVWGQWAGNTFQGQGWGKVPSIA